MRDSSLLQAFKHQEQDNRFFSASIGTLAASQQALENIMTRPCILPLLLVCSIFYPRAFSKMLQRETEKIRRNNNGNITVTDAD